MTTTGARASSPEATLGSLKIPAPKHFYGKGKEDDTTEFETFSRQLKAYLSIQTRRYKDLMEASEQSANPIGVPSLEGQTRVGRLEPW